MQRNRNAKTEVIMSRSLKSFDELSLKVVGVRTADDSDFEFEFPASGHQTTPSALTTLLELTPALQLALCARHSSPFAPTSFLEQLAERRDDAPEGIHIWHHGGLNE